MRIVLIGFMGSGKTTVGEALANKLGYKFADLDKAIEAGCNSSITEIFKTKGEEHFRKLEQEMLNTLLGNNNYVIATGGGTPCFKNNMETINKNGISIYLKMNAEALFDRLKHETTSHRPLIKDLNDKELKQYIAVLLEKREPYYSKAHYTIKSKDIRVGALADFIKQESAAVAVTQIR